ncbi:unnamed protein product [Didymodactylos carnosus]|uniref:Uncharacterized protein n=2 Tax=Didymodactylos carnosus TaxID=1234261 RepID=A0A8S2DQE6_9BILA|nr:unnamed protein product [Didymodactylos carnosus]CAF3772635.1 unnamed protein product [Didymodactylos carnosus]
MRLHITFPNESGWPLNNYKYDNNNYDNQYYYSPSYSRLYRYNNNRYYNNRNRSSYYNNHQEQQRLFSDNSNSYYYNLNNQNETQNSNNNSFNSKKFQAQFQQPVRFHPAAAQQQQQLQLQADAQTFIPPLMQTIPNYLQQQQIYPQTSIQQSPQQQLQYVQPLPLISNNQTTAPVYNLHQ